jgi:hypothetical protein
MTETTARDDAPSPRTMRCPSCGGRLGDPVSGDLHCYVECGACHSRFGLDDPQLAEEPERPDRGG